MKKINVDLALGIYFILYVSALVLFIGFDHPLWTDEGHFYRTIKLFHQSISINNLKHYNEMSTPLPFILYALWAKIGTLDIAWLRVFSIIIALATYFTFYKVLQKHFNLSISALLTAFLSLNPYMIGTSFFVYTDMITVFAIILSLYYFQHNNTFLMFCCCVFSLWCRQYSVFYVLSLALYYFIQFILNKQTKNLWSSIIIGSSILTLVPLFYLWHDLSPINEMKNLYLGKPLAYHFNGLTAYIVTIGVYCLPIISFAIYKNRKAYSLIIIISLIITSFIYQFFPISPSECGVEAGFLNIGFIDKILHKLISNRLIIDILYQVIFCFSLAGIFILIKSIKQDQISLLIIISMSLFLIVMPFSYLVWEKYILPLLPIIIIGFSKTLKLDIINKEISEFK